MYICCSVIKFNELQDFLLLTHRNPNSYYTVTVDAPNSTESKYSVFGRLDTTDTLSLNNV